MSKIFSQELITQSNFDLDSIFNKWQTTKDELTIKVTDLETLVDSVEVIYIDIRAQREIKVSKIPQSITIKEFESLLDDKNYDFKNKVFVAYCTVGYRSGKFTQKYNSPKIKVLNLWGGILDWVKHEKEIVNSSDEKTLEVHVYDKNWNFIPPQYKAIF